MAEYAAKRTRGMMVTLVFTMQAAGLIFGPILAAALIASGLSQGITWRLLLAFGAVPAMAVFRMRRHLAETLRFLLAAGHHQEFNRIANEMLGRSKGEAVRREAEQQAAAETSFWEGFARLMTSQRLALRLIGASLPRADLALRKPRRSCGRHQDQVTSRMRRSDAAPALPPCRNCV
jgi:MFS transporter, PHS family, inorganic phosphate transporter